MAIDQKVIGLYRDLLKTGFKYAGSIKNPSIFLDSEKGYHAICDVAGMDYVNIYAAVEDGVITEIRYLCSCDPAANVVIEAMCEMVDGKTLDEAKALTPEMFFERIGSNSEVIAKKSGGVIELLNSGIDRYLNERS
jgi:NifU-like protein involved in Fe-S cluster formation